MKSPAENLLKLIASKGYREATVAYTNEYRHGAGRQRPGSVGFVLWLLYDTFYKQRENRPPNAADAEALAIAYGINLTRAANALAKWSAHNEPLPPRTGAYAKGARKVV